ncbi:MAG: SDR family oxidoreductase [Pelatocladus maniniholoensis HA4357-MV3]|jgi:short-subunit dehydrogenase|uniref:SDR family oxidoreductase n=1 Tax=Pelatocladus maniniholoensis HA4357-MV3 TaxID=1117104 RepID=A0A9E3LSE2_9NOST|nr:SDR family oxidoreductase [Pelatocladus maniniholoensis HA4357-MV3]BAZ67510.1 putative dehydrogenase [Fischerella sp. NIES-4106]
MSTALITGASGGIGKAFAEELAARNHNLVLVARSENKLNELAKQLYQKCQVQVDVIAKDLTEIGATNSVFEFTKQKGLTIDLLINNAGFGDYGDFAETDEERQIKMLQLNILALVDLTHKYLPLMRERRSGSIINVSSIAAFQPIPYLSVYSASKAFVRNFSEALWAENRQYGVRVLVSCPGPTETNFFTQAKFPPALANKTNQISTPEEVVKETLKALEREDSTVVIGGFSTHFITKVAGLVPRETLLNLLEKQFKA